ncbi:MAG: cysteine--tRNA ligase [Candidatus Omnitrophota bacterium]|nr:MAG: cysteine--tRNA ligase [Candidatus Omnitrophota bacterium]
MKIYNSLTRKKETFKPIKKNQVGMYVCGPTVYDEPHIGHARSAYIFEVIRRYFEYKKYKVKFVRNVTDVDDKIINKAKEEFKTEDIDNSVKKVAAKYLSAYYKAMDELGIAAKGSKIKEPKASEYIDKMKDFIKILIKKKSAYESGGDVYFDITKAKNYGKLSKQSQEAMQAGARIAPTEHKKNPLDFALWKSAKEGEPSWDSPWGKGRPGWHIECSVMSTDILGGEFDIHGGGLDLIFPHHENEIAQAEAAGKKFARNWMHHGLLTINGQKMAKSLGNFITVDDFLKEYKHPNILKFFFLSTHYRNPIDYTKKRIEEARKNNESLLTMMNKVNSFFSRHISVTKERELKKKASQKKFIFRLKQFEDAMDDDFNTPRALAVLYDIINQNLTVIRHKQLLSHEDSLQQLYDTCRIILPSIRSVFGLDLNIPPEMGGNLDEKFETLIEQRNKARKEGNFAQADKIRKELEQKGIILEDTKEGTIWRRKI